jgi:hypothetical protein
VSRDEALATFEERGMVLVQGQGPIPSLADLIAGRAVTTRGYSWDYVPAWTLRDELDARDDVAVVKLVGGRTTMVHARHWPAIEALSRASRATLVGNAMLARIERAPGIPGRELKEALGLTGKDGSRKFQRWKNELEVGLAIVGREQEDADHHTHDAAWFPWAASKIASGVRGAIPTIDEAVASLDVAPAFLPVLRNLDWLARAGRGVPDG